MKTNKHSFPLRIKGFTLVELLVVMSIIGVLAALAVGSFRTAQMRGRDATRKSDLKQISNALELFYADYNRYPSASGGKISACSYNPALGTGTTCDWGIDEITDGKTVYFKVLPADPTESYTYTYEIIAGSNNQKYKLFARLENTEDQDCIDGNCAQNPNFAVTSANTSAGE